MSSDWHQGLTVPWFKLGQNSLVRNVVQPISRWFDQVVDDQLRYPRRYPGGNRLFQTLITDVGLLGVTGNRRQFALRLYNWQNPDNSAKPWASGKIALELKRHLQRVSYDQEPTQQKEQFKDSRNTDKSRFSISWEMWANAQLEQGTALWWLWWAVGFTDVCPPVKFVREESRVRAGANNYFTRLHLLSTIGALFHRCVHFSHPTVCKDNQKTHTSPGSSLFHSGLSRVL